MDKEARFFERIVRTHYWQKMPSVVEKIPFENRTFFSKYKRVDAPLTDALIAQHRQRRLILAHPLVDANDLVPHLLIDYNGNTPGRFYHHAGKILRDLGYEDIITFHSASPDHLHLYVFVDGLPLQKAYEQGRIINEKLMDKLSRQWNVLPSKSRPPEYAIAAVPYQRFSL